MHITVHLTILCCIAYCAQYVILTDSPYVNTTKTKKTHDKHAYVIVNNDQTKRNSNQVFFVLSKTTCTLLTKIDGNASSGIAHASNT